MSRRMLRPGMFICFNILYMGAWECMGSTCSHRVVGGACKVLCKFSCCEITKREKFVCRLQPTTQLFTRYVLLSVDTVLLTSMIPHLFVSLRWGLPGDGCYRGSSNANQVVITSQYY